MIYEKSIRTLELPGVLERAAEFAASETAKERIRSLLPLEDIEDMQRSMQETQDALSLMATRPAPAFSGLRDITESVGRAERGGTLNPAELLRIAAFLRTARDTKAWMSTDRRDDAPGTSIDHYFQAIGANKFLEEHISACILSEEEMADNASPELASIRRQIRAANARVREVLHRIVSSPSYQKLLQENIITIRGDRYVVPVKIECKGSFPGLVHDVSASGQTVYIEPNAVVEANNELRILASREHKEIERILAELSDEVAQFAAGLADDFRILTELDVIFARARFALDIDGQPPKLTSDGAVVLRRARHPLLPRDTAVPIDIRVGDGFDTLVITGPNTGGKTVALKTMGLLTLMAMCGLHIPAEYDSRVSVFTRIFADIGDEQSISQSLSTFSSHMTTIVGILGELDEHSMVLFDELGAGTDPVEGAALAQAIIEHIRGRGARVLATTHYAELKSYALTTEGVENAACEFDLETLKPTYRLLIGVPGKSNAFAISRRLGLPEEIVRDAKSSLQSENVQFEDVLNRLEQERQAMERERMETRELRRAAEETNKRAAAALAGLDRERERELEAARKKAQDIIEEARSAAQLAYDELDRMRREAAADAFSKNISEARATVGRVLNEAKAGTRPEPKKRVAENSRPIRVGDTVELLATGNRATVLEISGKKLRLQAGILQISAKAGDVQLVESEAEKETKKVVKTAVQAASATMGAATSVDLRGMNADEAEMVLQRFLDTSSMANLKTVTVIHGKGTGVLRQAVQNALKRDRRVASFRLGRYGEGDLGVTVVELK